MMKYERNPIGVMIMNMNRPHDNEMYAHIERSKYAAVSVLDSNHMIKNLPRLGVIYPLTRFYTFEPHAHTTDEQAVKDYAYARYEDVKNIRRDAQTHYIIVQINNEQGFRDDDNLMYYYMMEAASKDPEGPVGMAFGNFAPGTPATGFWGQENDWERPSAQKFLQGFAEFGHLKLPGTNIKAFYIGDHEYTTWFPLMAVNGGKHRENIPSNLFELHQLFIDDPEHYYIDWRLPQDHLGRNYQGIMKALGAKPINDGREWSQPRFAPPDIINTEMLFDAMGDVQNFYAHEFVPTSYSAPSQPSRLQRGLERIGKLLFHRSQVDSYEYALQAGISKEALIVPEPVFATQNYAAGPRGALTYKRTWMKSNWWGSTFDRFEDAWMYQEEWPWVVLYPQTTVRAGTRFSKGWTSEHWLSFQSTPDFERLEENYTPLVPVVLKPAPQPEPEPEPEPEPPTPPVPQPERTFVALVNVNVRENPGVVYPKFDILRTGVSYNVYENSRFEDEFFVWWELVDGGWVAERSIDGKTVLMQEKQPENNELKMLVQELENVHKMIGTIIERYKI